MNDIPRTDLFSYVFMLFLYVSLSLLITCTLTACEEDLDLRDDFPEPFSLYGVLSPDLSTQYVRVYPIDTNPRLDQEVPEGILFTSTDLMTGEEITWSDTIDVAPNGQRDLVFKATFEPVPERVYRVQATRMEDGASSFADVRIPPMVSIRSEDIILEPKNEAILDVIVEGEGIRLLKPQITYSVRGCKNGQVGEQASYTFPHHRLEEQLSTGWHIPFNIWVDRLFVTGEYGFGIEPFTLMVRSSFPSLIPVNCTWSLSLS